MLSSMVGNFYPGRRGLFHSHEVIQNYSSFYTANVPHCTEAVYRMGFQGSVHVVRHWHLVGSIEQYECRLLNRFVVSRSVVCFAKRFLRGSVYFFLSGKEYRASVL